MTEDLSSIYEDVDIRAWAQDIRLMKTIELQETINESRESLKGMIEFCYPMRFKTTLIEQINYLQSKLDILKTK